MKSFPLTLTDRVIKPARLCIITRRDGTVLRIAEAQSAITVTADATYTPVAGLEISSVTHTLGGDMPSLTITATHAVGGTIATADIDKGLYDAAEVELYIVNRANPTTKGLMFTGTIQPVTYGISGGVTFDVRGIAAEATTGYIQLFSPTCRTDLFSPLCGLTAASFDHTGTIGTIINRFNFTVAGLGSPPADGWFNQGVIVTAGGIAFECANWNLAGLRVTSYLPTSRLITEGEGITLYPGCDKRIATCTSKFANQINFQGEPHSIGVSAAMSGA
jgi:uncharacterized phage protein (TIGR02218 family)